MVWSGVSQLAHAAGWRHGGPLRRPAVGVAGPGSLWLTPQYGPSGSASPANWRRPPAISASAISAIAHVAALQLAGVSRRMSARTAAWLRPMSRVAVSRVRGCLADSTRSRATALCGPGWASSAV
jgi:hypothetical protein